jgi:hypothetical protein
MLAKMQSEKVQKPDTNTPEWVQELAIIKGKPIYVEGSYYMIRPKTEETNESDENSGKDITNAKDAIGGFMKKKLFGKKRKESELKPILVYVNEVIKLGTDNFSEDIFYIPKDYKEKKEK